MFRVSKDHRTQDHQLEEQVKPKLQMYRQGDVLLIRVDRDRISKKTNVHEAQPAPHGVILAYGETTGHAHVLDPQKVEAWIPDYAAITARNSPSPLTDLLKGDVKLKDPADPRLPSFAWDAAADRFINVMEKTALKHLDLPRGSAPTGEHADIELEPGLYKVVRQREWDETMRQRYVSD
jgi:hypothetical protein